jgi:hypothetical protein
MAPKRWRASGPDGESERGKRNQSACLILLPTTARKQGAHLAVPQLNEDARQIIAECERSYCFLVNTRTSDLEFFRLDDGVALSEELLADISKRGLRFAGVFGIEGIEIRLAMYRQFEDRVALALAKAVAVFVCVLMGDEVQPQTPDDFSAFMTGLMRDDPRV